MHDIGPVVGKGCLTITRGPGAADPYNVEEIPGLSLTGAEEVDLCDHYDSWESLVNLVDNCSTAKLCQDIMAGDIVITMRTDPKPLNSEDLFV